MSKKNSIKIKPCVIGLGYVGLPLLLNLSKKFSSVGYDLNKKRIKELKKGIDIFQEIEKKKLRNQRIKFTDHFRKIKKSNLFIVAVPTPIFKSKKPNLNHIKNVCTRLSKIIKDGDIIIFESTVYPGVTNDICIPLLEKYNNFKEGKNFYVGYSPERVNPGDKKHNLKKINKILAYPHEYQKKKLINIYTLLGKKIIFTKNIKEAEAAKVIENIQRDVNIGLINEIYLACDSLDLNFRNVNNLAKTKWNFLKFNPGLVGGHCLPVDPYYFASICKKKNFSTKITLAGRIINNSMTINIKNKIEKKILKIKDFKKKKLLICGLTYKKNVADLRNSLSLEIFKLLKNKYKNIFGYDPLVEKNLSKKNQFSNRIKNLNQFDFFINLVEHDSIKKELDKLKKKEIINVF